jgi:hypothetical protein
MLPVNSVFLSFNNPEIITYGYLFASHCRYRIDSNSLSIILNEKFKEWKNTKKSLSLLRQIAKAF